MAPSTFDTHKFIRCLTDSGFKPVQAAAISDAFRDAQAKPVLAAKGDVDDLGHGPKNKSVPVFLLFLLAVGPLAAPAAEHEHHHHPHAGPEHTGHVHTGVQRHAHSAAGRPGKAARVGKTVYLKALDSMRFEPAVLNVKRGQTIRLIFSNEGQIPHEAVLGNAAEQRIHENEMQTAEKSGGVMDHHHPNAVSLEPGKSQELLWQFTRPGAFEIGCHLPGHYAAGMVGKIVVR